MAEVFGEYDIESPAVSQMYCQKISCYEFEHQANKHTEEALKKLLDYLEYNPTPYYNVLRRREQEEAENANMLSYLKTKLKVMYYGENYTGNFDPKAGKEKLEEFKKAVEESYNYSQGMSYWAGLNVFV